MSAMISIAEYTTVNYGEDQGSKKWTNEFHTDSNAVADVEYAKIVRDYMASMTDDIYGDTLTVRNAHGENWASVAMWIDADIRYVHISVTFNIPE